MKIVTTWSGVVAAALLLGAHCALATPLRLPNTVEAVAATEDDLSMEATAATRKKERFAHGEEAVDSRQQRWVMAKEVRFVEDEEATAAETESPRTNLRSGHEEDASRVWKSVDYLRGNLSHSVGVLDAFIAQTDHGRKLEEEAEMTQRILRDIGHHHEHRRLVAELFSGGEEDQESHIALWPCNWGNIKDSNNLPDGNWTSSQKTKWGEGWQDGNDAFLHCHARGQAPANRATICASDPKRPPRHGDGSTAL